MIPTLDLSSKISYIIDSAYFKQNKFTPASHLPIVVPDYFHNHPVDTIIIIAPGYTDEIAEIIRQNLSTTISIYTVRSNHLERL